MVERISRLINRGILKILLNAVYVFVVGPFSVSRLFDPLELKRHSETALRERSEGGSNKDTFAKPY